MTIFSSDPASDCIPVTPSDTVDTEQPFRAIRVSADGNVQITNARGKVRINAFLAGETRPLAGTRVWNTNTTSTGIEVYI